MHDFVDPGLGKAIPYGVYDLARNEAWVSVGIDHDTAELAVATLLRWWNMMGRKAYPNATKLLVTADGGGSNASRSHLWKKELQAFATATGLHISVSHFPPGTSKWKQDRAPALLSHHPKLARQTARQQGGDRAAHSVHDDEARTARSRTAR